MLAGMLQANNPFLIIIAGLMIGLLHAFEPDHLSAVSTQLLRNKDNSKSSKKLDLQNLSRLIRYYSLKKVINFLSQ
jgi:ABC-type nickel/cobalt efflux system permease component RcnA